MTTTATTTTPTTPIDAAKAEALPEKWSACSITRFSHC